MFMRTTYQKVLGHTYLAPVSATTQDALQHRSAFTHAFIHWWKSNHARWHLLIRKDNHTYTYTDGRAIRSNFGFRIMPRDTSTCRLQGPGIIPLPFRLVGDCSISWAPDAKIATVQTMKIAPLVRMPEQFLASGFISWLRGQLNTHSIVTITVTAVSSRLTHQLYIMMTSQIFGFSQLAECSTNMKPPWSKNSHRKSHNQHCLQLGSVNSFTDISVLIAVMGKMHFGTQGNFKLQYSEYHK